MESAVIRHVLWGLLWTSLTCISTNGQPFVDPNVKVVRVDPSTGQFLDAFGRSRWFHGTNLVTKSEPYYPPNGGPDVCNNTLSNTLCDSDMDYLQELGVNVLRLGVMWPGAEPVRGVYDAKYFDVIHGIIQRLATRGIYTLVDVHQDVFSKQFCGEGVPDWFVQQDWIGNLDWRFPFPQKAEPFTVDEQGVPFPYDQCWSLDWFVSYLTVAVGDAFGKLYSNHDGLANSFCNYWGRLAVEYGKYNSVLGYDLLNEPWAGDIWNDPTLLVPGVAAKKVLEPLWNHCNDVIRLEDNTTIVFFESVTWDIVDGHVDVPGKDGSKTAMSYHYYSPPQLGLRFMYSNRLKDQYRLKTGGMLTEFRMWAGDEPVMEEMRATIDLADEYLQSWMGWAFSTDRDTNLEIEKHYARTYAPAVAGIVQSMKFNEDTSEYSITWIANTKISAPTELKVNRRIYYPSGIELNVSPPDSVTWEEIDKQNINLYYTDSAISGNNITVTLMKKEPSLSTASNLTSGLITILMYFTLACIL